MWLRKYTRYPARKSPKKVHKSVFKKKQKTFHGDRFLFLKHFNLKILKLGLNSDPFWVKTRSEHTEKQRAHCAHASLLGSGSSALVRTSTPSQAETKLNRTHHSPESEPAFKKFTNPTCHLFTCTAVIDSIFSISLWAGMEAAHSPGVWLVRRKLLPWVRDNSKPMPGFVIFPSTWCAAVPVRAPVHELAALGRTHGQQPWSTDASLQPRPTGQRGCYSHLECSLVQACVGVGRWDRARVPCKLWYTCQIWAFFLTGETI